MSAVHYRPRYTVDDYRGWEGDWELWDGVPVAMSPSPTFWHGMACAALAEILRSQIKRNAACSDCFLAVEVDWIVSPHDVVCPDLSMVCGKLPEGHIENAPTLIAEILSPATREKDLTVKKALYAQEGVAFYLIGDPETKELTILRRSDADNDDDECSYVETNGTDLTLHDDCVVSIDPTKVFS